MNWICLIVAGLFEAAFTAFLGKANAATGSEAKYWYAAFLVCLIISMTLLVKASKQIPLGTAYAVWTGIGAVGAVLVGIIFFNESADFWRIFFICTLIASVVGLKIVAN